MGARHLLLDDPQRVAAPYEAPGEVYPGDIEPAQAAELAADFTCDLRAALVRDGAVFFGHGRGMRASEYLLDAMGANKPACQAFADLSKAWARGESVAILGAYAATWLELLMRLGVEDIVAAVSDIPPQRVTFGGRQ